MVNTSPAQPSSIPHPATRHPEWCHPPGLPGASIEHRHGRPSRRRWRAGPELDTTRRTTRRTIPLPLRHGTITNHTADLANQPTSSTSHRRRRGVGG